MRLRLDVAHGGRGRLELAGRGSVGGERGQSTVKAARQNGRIIGGHGYDDVGAAVPREAARCGQGGRRVLRLWGGHAAAPVCAPSTLEAGAAWAAA